MVHGSGPRLDLEAAARAAREQASQLARRVDEMTALLARLNGVLYQPYEWPEPACHVPPAGPPPATLPTPTFGLAALTRSEPGDALVLAMKILERRQLTPIMPAPRPMTNLGGICGLPPVTSWTVPGPALDGRGFGFPAPRMW